MRVNSPSDFASDKEALLYYSVVKIRECLKRVGKRKEEEILCVFINRQFFTQRSAIALEVKMFG